MLYDGSAHLHPITTMVVYAENIQDALFLGDAIAAWRAYRIESGIGTLVGHPAFTLFAGTEEVGN
ncbi:hypothetical protein [Aeromonas veronii]|nr:hypothetical protein [Aeromonas veronii]WFO53628.1 hypothetical protein L1O00_19515 [Aeromonas veronii]